MPNKVVRVCLDVIIDTANPSIKDVSVVSPATAQIGVGPVDPPNPLKGLSVKIEKGNVVATVVK